jgi:hypothetical protein
MTQGQHEVVTPNCPRCGGLMHKPAGSILYWHTNRNHPRCDITNIIETLLEIPIKTEKAGESPSDPTPGRHKKGK